MFNLLRSTVKFLVDLPFKKIPIYYIPLGIGLYYATRETIMIATSTWLYNQLEEETLRREKLEKENQDKNDILEEFSDVDEYDASSEEFEPNDEVSKLTQENLDEQNSTNTNKQEDSTDTSSSIQETESLPKSDETDNASITSIGEESINEILDATMPNFDKKLSWGEWLWGNDNIKEKTN